MNSADHIAWVRRINDRWFVREGFRQVANDYLDHLAETDPERLVLSCYNAKVMCSRRRSDDDPKPWFYAGLFSLATFEEAAQFLRDRDFTLACIPKFAEANLGALNPKSLAKQSAELIYRVREAFDSLEADPSLKS